MLVFKKDVISSADKQNFLLIIFLGANDPSCSSAPSPQEETQEVLEQHWTDPARRGSFLRVSVPVTSCQQVVMQQKVFFSFILFSEGLRLDRQTVSQQRKRTAGAAAKN